MSTFEENFETAKKRTKEHWERVEGDKSPRADYADVPAILRDMADTFEERNKVYGNSGIKVGRVMNALFPNGYSCRTEADHRMMDHFNRVIAKLVRFVNSDLTHVDSIHDLAVYAAMCEAVAREHAANIKPAEAK